MIQQCAMLAKGQPGVIDPSGLQKLRCIGGALGVFQILQKNLTIFNEFACESSVVLP